MDVIFDIDGTLLNIEHRLKFIKKSPKDWKSFRDPKQKHWDEPIVPVINLMSALYFGGETVILCSGRTLSEKEDTLNSLKSYTGEWIYDIPSYFRNDGDFREDTVVKSELLDAMYTHDFEPTMVFDDRPSVIRMWRERGLKVADVGYGEEF
jgi:hypothetical protein